MALTEDDLKALRSLMREKINEAFEQRFEPSRAEVDRIEKKVDRHDKYF